MHLHAACRQPAKTASVLPSQPKSDRYHNRNPTRCRCKHFSHLIAGVAQIDQFFRTTQGNNSQHFSI
jgi:hypothetical protein